MHSSSKKHLIIDYVAGMESIQLTRAEFKEQGKAERLNCTLITIGTTIYQVPTDIWVGRFQTFKCYVIRFTSFSFRSTSKMVVKNRASPESGSFLNEKIHVRIAHSPNYIRVLALHPTLPSLFNSQ